MNTRALATGLLAASLAGTALATEVGQVIPPFTLEDQTKSEQTLGPEVRRIYATADRKGDSVLKAVMAELDQAALDAQNAIVVAEISAAPWFVKRIIRGDLKDRSYTTWMDTEGDTRRVLPYREDGVVIIDLDALTITNIGFAADEASLREALATPEPDASE